MSLNQINMSRFRLRPRAFTLIELLIVITIIGILAVALVPRLTGGPARARDAQRKADLQQIATALEFYADDNGTYPVGPNGVCADTLTLTNYLTTMPKDPSNDGWGTVPCSTNYTYYSLNSQKGYLLVADLETETDKDSGVYKGSTGGPGKFVVDSAVSAASNFTANVTRLCSATDCSTDAIYVVGR